MPSAGKAIRRLVVYLALATVDAVPVVPESDLAAGVTVTTAGNDALGMGDGLHVADGLGIATIAPNTTAPGTAAPAKPHHSLVFIGIILQSIGALGVSAGLLIQKRAGMPELTEWLRMTKLVGIAVFFMGFGTNYVAVVFAPLALLAPISSAVLLFNVILSPFIVGERVTLIAIIGATITAAGASVMVVFGPKTSSTENHGADELDLLMAKLPFLGFCGALAIASVAIATILLTVRRADAARMPSSWQEFLRFGAKVLMYGILTATLRLCGKVILQLLSKPHARPLTAYYSSWVFSWIGLISTFAQLVAANMALAEFPALLAVPVMQSMVVTFTVAFGGVYFKEFDDLSHEDIAFFGTGFAVLCIGCRVLLLQKTDVSQEAAVDSPSGGRSRATSCGSTKDMWFDAPEEPYQHFDSQVLPLSLGDTSASYPATEVSGTISHADI